MLIAGKPEEAVASFRDAARHDPVNLAAWGGIGEALARQGKAKDASVAFDHLFKIIGGQAGDLGNLGGQLFGHGWRHAALALWQAAEVAAPSEAIWPANQATALKLLGRLPEARIKAWHAFSQEPELDVANRILGELAEEEGDLVAAIRHFAAIEQPDAHVLAHLAQNYLLMGDGERASLEYAKAAEIDSTYASASLMALQYRPDMTFEEIVGRHLDWGRRFPVPNKPAWRHKAEQDLRVGFVSADFRHHATGVFLPPLLRERKKHGWQAVLYSNTRNEDGLTERFKSLCDDWRDIRAICDSEAADLVRADGIDILFDLNGHTAGNRLGLFALRPAPAQVSFMDYVCTTGLRQIDYLLHDRIQLPPAEAEQFSEQVLYFDGDTLVYEPPSYAPDVAPAPCLQNGFVTFGSFNALFKISETCIGLWASIMREAPDSRLLMASPNLKYDAARERLMGLFKKFGIQNERLTLLGEADHQSHLQRFGQVDLVLDSQPYSGGLTTCEALWMGVPVIAMLGDRLAGRHAASHLTAAGFQDLVAQDADSYVRLATELADQPSRLIELRLTMRARVAPSPLCDSGGYSSRFMSILEEIKTLTNK